MLRVGQLNIFHLHGKIADLASYLHNATPAYDIFGVTESRLRFEQSETAVTIANYNIHRKDAKCMGQTGIVVYIHNSIRNSALRRKDLECEFIECMWLELKQVKKASKFICYLYRNPKETLEWYDKFVCMMDIVADTTKNADVLLLGDFNIDISKPHVNWESTFELFGLRQFIYTPTRVTESTSTIIDHIYSNNHNNIVSAGVKELDISDHYLVECNVNFRMHRSSMKCHTYIRYRSFKHFSKDHFLSDLAQAPFGLIYNHNNPDEALETWNSVFLSVVNKHAPLRRKRVKHQQLPPWLTKDIMQAMAERDRLKKAKNYTDYKKVRNQLKNMVRNSKRAYFNKVAGAEDNVRSIWQAMNTFIGRQKNSKSAIPSNLSAEDFNDFFVSIAESLSNQSKNDTYQYTCPKVLTDFCKEKTKGTDIFLVPPITTYKVAQYITTLPNKKSAGLDDINSTLLKQALPYVLDTLTYVFNLCISNCTFPADLKKAKVIPIPKGKEISQLDNYRPISVLPILSKVLEKHIHRHLMQFCEHRSLFHPLQSGYRNKHSCVTALVQMTNSWLTALNDDKIKMAEVVYLDLRKAFDMVSHRNLMLKLAVYLPNSPMLPLLESFITDRRQCVQLNGSFSTEKGIKRGVPQGSVLGPLLFCIFINDLPLNVTNKNVDCHMLADDTTLSIYSGEIKEAEASLQLSLNEANEWCMHNDMRINASKTKSMVLSTRQKHLCSNPTLNLTLNGEYVSQVSEHRLLGITIDEALSWQPHVEQLTKKLSKNLYLLSQLKHVITQEARELFYNAHIKSHIDYASVIWDGCSQNVMKQINSLHRRAAKLILFHTDLSTDEKMVQLEMPCLANHHCITKAILMFKIVNTPDTPKYLQEMFSSCCSPYPSMRNRLFEPRPRIDLYMSSFSYSGAHLWNKLPTDLRICGSVAQFKAKLLKAILHDDSFVK